MSNKGLMLVGGLKLAKDVNIWNLWERYVLDWEGNEMNKGGQCMMRCV